LEVAVAAVAVALRVVAAVLVEHLALWVLLE
jgi:hypothetical protein